MSGVWDRTAERATAQAVEDIRAGGDGAWTRMSEQHVGALWHLVDQYGLAEVLRSAAMCAADESPPPHCETQGCRKNATGVAYSRGVCMGRHCDRHGRYLMDSGQADACWPMVDEG